ncbi:Nitrogen permease regulator 2 [Cryomyces antarcticus]|nr:Nitrogen permease regulator 2 [Cryomyces antarcticus]
MIKSIFYTRFHPEKGPTVLHQVPEGSIIPCPPSPTAQTPLFDFSAISDFIIPRREFCDRLVTVCASHHRVIGYPVCIHAPQRYERNEFIFNFAIVLDEAADFSGYLSVVRKLAVLFRNLEEQGGFLSREEEMEGLIVAGQEGYGGGAKVYALCEMILEDLNNYCECMIPIDESNTLNLKLFPMHPPPAPIHSYHVPLSTVRLSSLATSTWDLTMSRILPYINGINSVAQIAQRADTDFALTRKAVAHLLYYGCILLLDVFQFGAIYAPTAEIGAFFGDEALQDECRRYVATAPPVLGDPGGSRSGGGGGRGGGSISRATILRLYASLKQGLILKAWCIEHRALLPGIDVRRFVTFGVIKGFLYRVHKYAIASRASGPEVDAAEHELLRSRKRNAEREWRAAATSSGWATPTAAAPEEEEAVDPARADHGMGNGSGTTAREREGRDLLPLARYLDGAHCVDEICAELRIGEKEVLAKLKGYGDVQIVHR